MRNKFRLVMVITALVLTATACGVETAEGPKGNQGTLISLTVLPANPSIAPGTTIRLSAKGKYSNNATANLGTTVTWSSSDPAVASVSNAPGSQGLVTAGSSTGTAVISAVYTGITGSTAFTSSSVAVLTLSSSGPASIAPGTSRQFTATATLENGASQDLTARAAWSAADPAVASVSSSAGSEGLVAALTAGSTDVRAMYGGVTGTAPFSASHVASITTSPPSTNVNKGNSVQFSATAALVDGSSQDLTSWATWNSSNTAVATFNNSSDPRGLLTAVNSGSTSITALFDSVLSSPASPCTVTQAVLTSIALAPASASIPLGKTKQFTAKGTYSDGTTGDVTASATWNSSNTAVAVVSNSAGTKGLATPKALGSTSITATLSGVTSASAALTVTTSALASILVTPITAQIITTNCPTLQFTATGTYTDGSLQDITTAVTWSSSNTHAATVSNAVGTEGVATGGNTILAGTVESTDITAALSGITSNIAVLSVTPWPMQ